MQLASRKTNMYDDRKADRKIDRQEDKHTG